MNPEEIGQRLADAAETDRAGSGLHVRSIRGVRGSPHGVIARVAAEAWKGGGWKLPRAEDALNTLFGAAWEDGIVAIGLLAASVPDRPHDALEIARGWLDRIDDSISADAVGWLVLGPSALASRQDLVGLASKLRTMPRPETRRAAVMAAMASLPVPIEGPAGAPLRERIGSKDVQFVEHVVPGVVGGIADLFVRDEDPIVRKALRRVLGAWAAEDADGATEWLEAVKGGAPRLLRDEVEKAAKKARRREA